MLTKNYQERVAYPPPSGRAQASDKQILSLLMLLLLCGPTFCITKHGAQSHCYYKQAVSTSAHMGIYTQRELCLPGPRL